MTKFNEQLCELVRTGKLAIEYHVSDCTPADLNKVLHEIFPDHPSFAPGFKTFYFASPNISGYWNSLNITDLPTRPVSDFFLPDTPLKDSVAEQLSSASEQGEKVNEGTELYPLFKFFADAHDLILLESEIELIIDKVVKFNGSGKKDFLTVLEENYRATKAKEFPEVIHENQREFAGNSVDFTVNQIRETYEDLIAIYKTATPPPSREQQTDVITFKKQDWDNFKLQMGDRNYQGLINIEDFATIIGELEDKKQ